MLIHQSIKNYHSFLAFRYILIFLSVVHLSVGDEARAIVADSVSRSHQEVVPPELDHDTSDDGPIVSPIDHSHFLENFSVDKGDKHEVPERFPFVRMDFTYAKPVIVGLWILISTLAKFGKYLFHYGFCSLILI
ncbi:hypothetical protein AVEN_119027-1 [Araneus ventricosus]|uniref:Uncharacterized protein n=1 Tax=Araneus ventricosus TaxID=182803 RepID=A0A4Y2FFE0_ARAVE|nr:hypothetical protein AVEN_119027-1 [Araneus ventricosus]